MRNRTGATLATDEQLLRENQNENYRFMSNDSLHSTPASARSGDTAAKLRSVRGVPSSGVGDLIFSKLCSGAAWFVVILFVLLVAILFWKSLLSFQNERA